MAHSIISSVRAAPPTPAPPHKRGGCANAIDSTQMQHALRTGVGALLPSIAFAVALRKDRRLPTPYGSQ